MANFAVEVAVLGGVSPGFVVLPPRTAALTGLAGENQF